VNPQEYIESGALEAYVLGLASPEEIALAERMRAEHSEVEDEYQAVLATVETWVQGYSKPAPEGAWDAIAARINSEEANERMIDSETADSVVPEISINNSYAGPLDGNNGNKVDIITEGGGRIVDINSIDTSRETGNYRFWQSVAAGLALLAAGSVAANMWQYGRQNDLKQELAAAQQQNTVLATTASQATKSRKDLQSFMDKGADPEFKRVVLNGLKDAPNAKVMVMWKKNSTIVTMAMKGMPAMPSDKDLQLWAIVDGKPVDLGIIPAKENELMEHQIPVVQGATAFAITLEDKGGHPQPQGVMLTMGEVKS
jgi:hypothetical protein